MRSRIKSSLLDLGHQCREAKPRKYRTNSPSGKNTNYSCLNTLIVAEGKELGSNILSQNFAQLR